MVILDIYLFVNKLATRCVPRSLNTARVVADNVDHHLLIPASGTTGPTSRRVPGPANGFGGEYCITYIGLIPCRRFMGDTLPVFRSNYSTALCPYRC